MSEPESIGTAPGPGPEPSHQRFSLKRHRLLSKDFGRIYSKGSRARGGLMTVVVMENELQRRRMGLSVGKRCAKHAVQRNRVRRVFREAFRLSQRELPPGIDVILIASTPGISPLLVPTQRELENLVQKAFRRYRERIQQAERRPESARSEGQPARPAKRRRQR